MGHNLLTYAKFNGPDFGTLASKRGKPDIILSNNHNMYNLAIQQGDLTTSDHLPIIVKISTKPIIKVAHSCIVYEENHFPNHISASHDKSLDIHWLTTL